MNRSGYNDDGENLELYRANVDRAFRGKRGQAFLTELLTQLEAMPEKRLIMGELEQDNEVCALGVVTRARHIDTSQLKFDNEGEEYVIQELRKRLNIADCMIREIMFENDEGTYRRAETPEQRWFRMKRWVEEQLVR